jgi:hypothetical protein
VVFVGDQAPPDDVRLDLDPADSSDATADALRHAVNQLWSSGQAVIIFDAAFALTVLDRELRRRLRFGLAVTGRNCRPAHRPTPGVDGARLGPAVDPAAPIPRGAKRHAWSDGL